MHPRHPQSRAPLSFGLFLGLLLLGLHARPVSAERVDRVAWFVTGREDTRVITESEIAVEKVLFKHLDCEEPMLCDTTRPIEQRVVEYTVWRAMAGDAVTYRPSTDEVERRVATLRCSWDSPEGYSDFLRRFGLTEDDLAGLVFSHMVVERYIRRTMTFSHASPDSALDSRLSVRQAPFLLEREP